MGDSRLTSDLEAALEALPIFPLPQVVLFPQALLPLHVFEERYRALLKDCLETHQAMAMALLIPQARASSFRAAQGTREDLPAIAEVAGVGFIVEHQPMPDGRSNILLHGRGRVKLEELPFVPPYRRARATLLHDEHDESIPPSDRTALSACADAFAAAVRQHNPDFSFRIPPNLEPGVLSDYCAHHLLVDTALRQQLLCELNPAERVRIVTRELATQHSALLRESGGLLH